jgi:hypothetical protein
LLLCFFSAAAFHSSALGRFIATNDLSLTFAEPSSNLAQHSIENAESYTKFAQLSF